MSVSVANFWKLVSDSRLLSVEQCRQLAEAAARAQPDAAADVQKLAKWLIQSSKLTRYQARVLLAGRPGPFFYGDYCLYDRAESGRLAGLFRARHLPTRQGVGLKFLTGPALQDADALSRLGPRVRAARHASRQQPRLSQCYHLADLGAYKFIVLEDLRGESLSERLARTNSGLPPAEACRIVRQIAQGLTDWHARSESHGQIRPDNVWLAPEGAKLLQFPLLGDPLTPQPSAAEIEAQTDYLSPESSAGAAADLRSDVYSLGCLLYRLLAGEAPYAGGSRDQKLARQAREAPTPIVQRNAAVPAALAQVLGYFLEKSPDRRYPDAAAVAESLAPYAGADVAAGDPTTPAYAAWLEQLERGGPAQAIAAPAVAVPSVARAVPIAPSGGANVGVLPAVPVANVAAPAAIASAPAAAAPQARPAPVVPALATEGAAASLAARRKKRGKTSATFGALALGAVLVFGTAFFLWWSDQPPHDGASAANGAGATSPGDSNKVAVSPTPATENTEAGSVAAADQPSEGIRSIDETIWQSPTDGKKRLDLAYLAPGCQLIVVLRPAELIDQPEWEKLVDPRTLGALSQWLTADLPKTTGKTLDQLESVTIGLLDASPKEPRLALVARASEPFVPEEMLTAWGDAKAEQIEGHTIYVAGDRGFFVPDGGEGKILVIAPPADLRETVKQGDQPPPLRRELELLAESSDADRQLTLLVAPNFLFTGGKSLLAERLLDPLGGFLEIQDSDQKLELPKGLMFSASFGEGNLFLELRIHDSFAAGSAVVAREYRHRINRLPKQVSGYVRDLQLSAYSKPVLWDYRDQLEVVDRYTRLGFEGKQIVLRAYLPEIAAHNLALGAHLALLENPGGSASPAQAAAQRTTAETIADKLNKKTSLTFPSNTLETAIKLLGDDIGVEMIILGGDLQVEGITKNQSFKLDEKDKSARDILATIMKNANPAGQLVYVIKAKEGTGPEVLYITTRKAAEKRGDKLPPELEKAK